MSTKSNKVHDRGHRCPRQSYGRKPTSFLEGGASGRAAVPPALHRRARARAPRTRQSKYLGRACSRPSPTEQRNRQLDPWSRPGRPARPSITNDGPPRLGTPTKSASAPMPSSRLHGRRARRCHALKPAALQTSLRVSTDRSANSPLPMNEQSHSQRGEHGDSRCAFQNAWSGPWRDEFRKRGAGEWKSSPR